jgi:hypothetical protein
MRAGARNLNVEEDRGAPAEVLGAECDVERRGLRGDGVTGEQQHQGDGDGERRQSAAL